MPLTEEQIARIHPNLKLLSHSSSVLLHKCPRKYELYKLTSPDPECDPDANDEHLNFGHAVGVGIQEYLQHGDIARAAFAIFMAWPTYLDDDTGERSKKTFWHALYALDKFANIAGTVFGNYELAYFEGKPAVELGFSIDCGNGFVYRGFLDALLIDRVRNELVVYEGKTTKFKSVHEASYKHSGQSLGYSVVIDTLAKSLGIGIKSSYTVKYCIYKSFAYEWEVLPFTKTHTQRALWIKNLLIDQQRVIEYATESYFPMHGENCYDFFRPCEWFGTCEMSNKYLVGEGKEIELKKDKEGTYQFQYKLEEIIEALLAGQE